MQRARCGTCDAAHVQLREVMAEIYRLLKEDDNHGPDVVQHLAFRESQNRDDLNGRFEIDVGVHALESELVQGVRATIVSLNQDVCFDSI